MSLATLKGAARAVAFIVVTVIGILVGMLLWPLGTPALTLVRKGWCHFVCALLGIRLQVEGQSFAVCPVLQVANHVSYLDIPILGAYTPGTFIAKSEVAGWPLFGLVAKIGRTMFVRRYWRDALIQRNRLARRMTEGESFILFAEGTSTRGLSMKPFKTSLFSVAEPWILARPIAVQPVTICYARLADGAAIDTGNAERYAWVDDAPLLPHLWNVLKEGGVEVSIVFGEPVMSWSVGSRKALAAAVREDMLKTMNRLRRRVLSSSGSEQFGVLLEQKIKEA